VGSLAYARWAVTRGGTGPWFQLSTLPFVLWLGRYGALLEAGRGEAPEDLIFRDRALLGLAAAWAALFVCGVYIAN
jgi:decaprenyl-phosphate phosphoribosyltransferase